MLSFKEYINEIKFKFSDNLENNPDTVSSEATGKVSDLVFYLGKKKIEFKSENEINSNGAPYFTWKEAMRQFDSPTENDWRLPEYDELEALAEKYSYNFYNGFGVFDSRLRLPACGVETNNKAEQEEISGYYWTSDSSGDGRQGWFFYFDEDEVLLDACRSNSLKYSVRLVRTIK